MKLSGIIWLEEIVEKIARKHHVSQEEIREVHAFVGVVARVGRAGGRTPSYAKPLHHQRKAPHNNGRETE